VGDLLVPLLQEFAAFFHVMEIEFDYDLSTEVRTDHVRVNRDRLQAACTSCLWTAYEQVQGDREAGSRGISFVASATDEATIELVASYVGRGLEGLQDAVFQRPSGRVWDAHLLLYAAGEIVRSYNGGCSYEPNPEANIFRLRLPFARSVTSVWVSWWTDVIMILLVEYNGLYRGTLKQLLAASTQHEVVDVKDPDSATERLSPAVRVLISNICFPDKLGNRDYSVAAAFLRTARERVGSNLSIIGLSTVPLADEALQNLLRENDFPSDVRYFDIVATRPRELVAIVVEELSTSIPYHV
jgi:hypothetical protein